MQTVMDYLFLTVLLHYSGGVENPLIVTFVFQCIIASMLFSPALSYLLAALAVGLAGAMIALEQTNLWPHGHLSGYVPPELWRDWRYVLGVLITLAIVLFVSVYLTTTIEIASRRRRSEVARHSAELEEAREQVRQADKMTALGQLAANMAHDINNPAGVICTRLEVMEAEGAFDNLPDRLRRDLAILGEHAQYLRRVAQNWTDFARKRSLHIGRIDLNEAVRRAVAMVADSLEPRRIRLEMGLRATPTFIGGDLVGLQQVILNLVNNACDAMPRGGTLRIHTALTVGADRSPHAFLDVADTGTGIAAEDLEWIFEPFFSRKPKGQGTGLGLTIARKIVKEMNGEIRVRSRPGEGTVFTIEFPADSTGERTATHAVG